MNVEYSYIFYTFFKNLQEMKVKPPLCLFKIYHMYDPVSVKKNVHMYTSPKLCETLDWLVGCFGLNGPLRQYFSLCRAISQREGERKEK